MLENVPARPNFPAQEEEILKFWQDKEIFKKSIHSKPEDKSFSFYDGPPFATGLPHYGHLLAGTIKDIIPRFKTMQGYRVDRIWGWDTHGLPIENIVEQELDIKSKIQVEEYGIDKFNEQCRTKVLTYAEEWKKIVERTGRWIDMENAYLTMNPQFMESVWWVFKTLHDKGLIYEGHKVMPYCPRCATPLSNFEVGLGYKDKDDRAITVKFQSADDPELYFLAWTTTPWTLPGNLALTIGPEITYATVEADGKRYILAENRLDSYKNELGQYKILETKKGQELLGKKYQPIFDYYKEVKKAFVVIAGDFVSTEDGTGIVHTAPAFGEDDYRVSKENGIDFFMPVDDLGNFTIDVPDYAGQSVVEFETNTKIINDLSDRVLKTENIKHSYPHCWRCKTPLIYKGVSSWFVAVEKVKARMLELNQEIYWLPDPIGHGRFQKLIENAPDWSISRNRFWGTPIPVFRCKDCDNIQVMGSIAELEKATGREIKDIHLHKVQEFEAPCACGGKAQISGEVLDCWFESGSMPYASIHYPFENQEKFNRDFPADFIAEGIDQTRGWFYSLLVLSAAIADKPAYKNVVVNGTVLAEDGQKMSKSLKNYPDPLEVVRRYGADPMRFALMSSPAVKASDLRFSEKVVEEVVKRLMLVYWNSYSFFVTYAKLADFKPEKVESSDVLDRWILSELNAMIKEATDYLEKYDISSAAREIETFVYQLSNWYIRRNRKRFGAGDKAALNTLYEVLVAFTKVLAPYMPFITENIYQNLVLGLNGKAPESVHLTEYPVADQSKIDEALAENMKQLRAIIENALMLRDTNGLKIRQPLSSVYATIDGRELSKDFKKILLDELNIKAYTEVSEGDVVTSQFDFTDLKGKRCKLEVKIDKALTPELKEEGLARDILRKIQVLRKESGFKVEDKINLYFETESDELKKALGNEIVIDGAQVKSLVAEKREVAAERTMAFGPDSVWLGFEKA